MKESKISPLMIIDMCNNFCDAINGGSFPTIKNSWK